MKNNLSISHKNHPKGSDWVDVLQQRSIEIAQFKELGIKLPEWAAGFSATNAAEPEDPEEPEEEPQPQ